MKTAKAQTPALTALQDVLDRRGRIYMELAEAPDFGAYLASDPPRDDEEILTEPVLADILERMLGFPADAYFPQLGKSGLKPDFTPMDLIAHPYVLDAKSSRQRLAAHEKQIRDYVKQRQLDFGVLFNLREVRVYRRAAKGHDPDLSFKIEPLWRLARGEAQPGPDLQAFQRFVEKLAYRSMGVEEKIEAIRSMPSWEERGGTDELRVDVDLLVAQLRQHSGLLAEDAEGQPEALEAHIKLNPGFEKKLLGELATIARDIAPQTKEDSLPTSVAEYRSGLDLERRIWHQYTLRVAQLTLARILLYRAWEDAGFIQEQLYDGGFRDTFAAMGERVRDVLRSAFAAGAQRYHWLYEQQSTYDWYTPGDGELVEVLYSLTQFPLDRLDADVLGGLYESYVDEIDRDRLGQFYTPRDVVRFMLDRADFHGPDGVLRIEGDARKGLKTFDFASGSGGFDVEIARRIIDDSGVLNGSPEDQLEVLGAIVAGLHAMEISPFPCYLTEINLLLQVSRLLSALGHAHRDVPHFVLGVVHEDALKAKRPVGDSLEGLEPEHRADHAVLTPDERFGLVGQLDPEKQAAFTRIREGSFDLVVGNPPYVAEANNKPLFERLRQIDAWKGIYRGKSDYLYYFLYMAAELLAPGGRLCVIVPAGWMNAGEADWLREKLASTLRLDELFLFGAYRLFALEEDARHRNRRAPTPTVESAILLATKGEVPKNHKLRVVALEDEGEAARALSGDIEARAPDRHDLLEEMRRRVGGRQGRKSGIHVHDVKQSELRGDRPWPVKHGAKDVPTRVVSHLQGMVDDRASVEPLDARASVVRGIETGADAFTPRIEKRLRESSPGALKRLQGEEVELGDPILELPAGFERKAPWSDHPDVLAKSIEPGAILYGALDEGDYTSLVWLDRSDQPPAAVTSALERWKPVLANRAEIARNESRHWWECAWPRDKQSLREPKLIALYRTDRGRFACDEAGVWQPSNKTTLVIPVEEGPSVAYLGGLLNSELLDLWYAVRGKTPWHVRRNYEPKRMKEMPYRHVDLSVKVGGGRLKELKASLKKGDAEKAASTAAEIAADLRSSGDAGLAADAPEGVMAAKALEQIVRAIADNRRALLSYRDRFPSLTRVVKDPWSAEEVDPTVNAFVSALSKKQRASVRIDPELSHSVETDGVLGRYSFEEDSLVFRYRREVAARVDGPREKMMVLAELIGDERRLMPADLLAMEVPRSVETFHAAVDAAQAEVEELLAEGRALVETAERLVCALYAVPVELEDEVVSHALARAEANAAVSA
ncbi:MAG TPA: N-6 DNA methylase [Solirubrobacterales bacterium]